MGIRIRKGNANAKDGGWVSPLSNYSVYYVNFPTAPKQKSRASPKTNSALES